MTSPTRSTVVGIGELLWDDFGVSRRPGGAPTNVAFHAAQLGHHGVVVSRVGDDEDGRALRAALAPSALDLSWLQEDPQHATGTVTVDASDPGRPSYTIHEDVAWDHLGWSAALEQLAERAAAVCFGTLAQRSTRSRETIQRFLRQAPKALVVYDVNLRQRYFTRERIERSLEAADVVKLNLDEVAELARLFELAPDPLAELAATLRERFELELVCVTRAEHGCALFERGAAVDLPGARVQVVDAVGAGDAFTAALISARIAGWDLPRTARFASGVAALVVARSGAMPALHAEYDELRKRCLADAAR